MTSIDRRFPVGSRVVVIDRETRLLENWARALLNAQNERGERFRIQECHALESHAGFLLTDKVSDKELVCLRVSHQ